MPRLQVQLPITIFRINLTGLAHGLRVSPTYINEEKQSQRHCKIIKHRTVLMGGVGGFCILLFSFDIRV